MHTDTGMVISIKSGKGLKGSEKVIFAIMTTIISFSNAGH